MALFIMCGEMISLQSLVSAGVYLHRPVANLMTEEAVYFFDCEA